MSSEWLRRSLTIGCTVSISDSLWVAKRGPSWNNIGPELRQTDKMSTFKSVLKGMIVPEEKSIFKIHNKNLSYLYQLRVGLSPLRAHKFRHNFLDTPDDLCTCQSGIESTTHFLLKCPLFDVHRELLMDIVSPIASVQSNISDESSVTNILLYGSKALNPTQNNEILNATLAYVQNTGRFANWIKRNDESPLWDSLSPRALCLFFFYPFNFCAPSC